MHINKKSRSLNLSDVKNNLVSLLLQQLQLLSWTLYRVSKQQLLATPSLKKYLKLATTVCTVTGNTDTPLPDIGTETLSTGAMGTNKGLMSYVH